MRKHATSSEKINEILAKPTMSVDEFSEVLSIGRSQAYAFVREGRIRSLRIGSSIRIPTSSVLELIEGVKKEKEVRNDGQ